MQFTRKNVILKLLVIYNLPLARINWDSKKMHKQKFILMYVQY